MRTHVCVHLCVCVITGICIMEHLNIPKRLAGRTRSGLDLSSFATQGTASAGNQNVKISASQAKVETMEAAPFIRGRRVLEVFFH